jgi:curved DNA-binding protein CbpA
MSEQVNHYSVLGLSRTATTKEIKAAYHRLARQTHPDVAGDNDARVERFMLITEAQRVLCDAQTRQAYDQRLAVAQAERTRASQAPSGQQPVAASRPVQQPPAAATRRSPTTPTHAAVERHQPSKSWLAEILEFGAQVLKLGVVVGSAAVVGDAIFGAGATYDPRTKQRRGPDGRFLPLRRR